MLLAHEPQGCRGCPARLGAAAVQSWPQRSSAAESATASRQELKSKNLNDMFFRVWALMSKVDVCNTDMDCVTCSADHTDWVKAALGYSQLHVEMVNSWVHAISITVHKLSHGASADQRQKA